MKEMDAEAFARERGQIEIAGYLLELKREAERERASSRMPRGEVD